MIKLGWRDGDTNQAYDVQHDRFIEIPQDVIDRIDVQLESAPTPVELKEALESTLNHLSGLYKADDTTIACKDTVHTNGPVDSWRSVLNQFEDTLRDKNTVAFAPTIELPRGVPVSVSASHDQIGAIRGIVYVDWDKDNWSSAHAGVAFTAVITKRSTRFP